MPVAVMPDAEAVVIAFLKAHAGLVAAIPAANISTAVNTAIWPVLTIARVGGTPTVAVRLDNATIDVSVWGATKTQASIVMRTACAAMLDMAGHVAASAVVTGVFYVLGPRWLPDDGRTPTIPRYLASFAVLIRPSA